MGIIPGSLTGEGIHEGNGGAVTSQTRLEQLEVLEVRGFNDYGRQIIIIPSVVFEPEFIIELVAFFPPTERCI